MPSQATIDRILRSTASTTHFFPGAGSSGAGSGVSVAGTPMRASLVAYADGGGGRQQLTAVPEGDASHPPDSVPLMRERSAPWRGHDGVISEFGKGRGYCNSCFRAVHVHKSYWRCACAAWSFNSHVHDVKTRLHFGAMLAFLDELYVSGTFSARTSEAIIMYLSVRTPLPSSQAAGAGAGAATGGLGGTAAAAMKKRDGVEPGLQAARRYVPMLASGGAGSAPTDRDPIGSNSNGVIFPPAPARFPRGEVYLLE